MYERFTDRARKVMQLANQEAQRFNHEYIGTEHILLGLIKEGSGVAANVLKNLDVDLRKIRLEVEKLVQSGPDMVTMGKLPQTPRAKKVIEYSMEEARNLNHNYVGTEHILLGLAARAGRRRRPGVDEPRAETGRGPRGGVEPVGPRHGRARGLGAARRSARGFRRRRRTGAAGRQVEDPRAGQLRPRSDRIGPARQARPGDRPREGDRADDANPRPAHEEQSRAAGRGRRGQDRHRRRVRPARGRGERPRVAAGSPHRRARPGDDGRRHEIPRPVRGTHQGGDERSPPREEHDPVHRRVAHPGRRRRGRRGHRRQQRVEARPVARRNPVHRRHHAGRVPQVHREGQRAGSPLPGGDGRAVDQGRGGRNPQGAPRPLRAAPPRADHQRRGRRGRRAFEPLHHRPLPARQGHRRDRRGRRPGASEVDDPSARPQGDRRRGREAEQGEGRGGGQSGFREGRRPARSGRQAEEEEAGHHARLAGEIARDRRRGRRGSHRRGGLEDHRRAADADDAPKTRCG